MSGAKGAGGDDWDNLLNDLMDLVKPEQLELPAEPGEDPVGTETVDAFSLAEMLRPHRYEADAHDLTISASVLSGCLEDIIAQHTILFQIILMSNLPTNARQARQVGSRNMPSRSRSSLSTRESLFGLEAFKGVDSQNAKGALARIATEVNQTSKRIPELCRIIERVKRNEGLSPQQRISEIQKAEYGCTEFLAQFRRFLIAANDLDFSQTANESKLDEIRRAQVFRILGLVNLLEAAQVTLTNVEKSLQDKSKDFTGADILMSMGAREKMWPKLKLSIDFSIVDKPHVYSLEARVPNMRKENFQVVSNNRSLVVTATRFPNEDDVRQLYKKVLLRSRERHETLTAHTEASMMLMLADGDFGTYKKSFSLPPNVDLSRVDVSFENGRLAIAMPRLTRAKSERPSSPAWSNSSANFRVPELNHSASERGQYHFYSDLSARSGSSNPFTRSPRPTKTNPPASPSSSSSSPSTPNGQTHSRWSFFKKPRVTVEPPPDTPPASSNNSNGGSHSLSGITPIDLGKVQNNLEDNGNNI